MSSECADTLLECTGEPGEAVTVVAADLVVWHVPKFKQGLSITGLEGSVLFRASEDMDRPYDVHVKFTKPCTFRVFMRVDELRRAPPREASAADDAVPARPAPEPALAS